LQTEVPDWTPRASWSGPPWQAQLHLSRAVDTDAVATAATRGVEAVAKVFDVDGRSNVSFESAHFRDYALRVRESEINASLVAALTAESPSKPQGDGLYAAPLVMMFGQGHQNFLDRLVAVPRGETPSRLKKRRTPPNMRDPAWIRDALFVPWRRQDDADGFRWDPEEDQRYALRLDDPSRAGAAPTVHGANRLAAIGFLSFTCVPRSSNFCAPPQTRPSTPGAIRTGKDVKFVWPLWRPALALYAIELLLSHPHVLGGRLEKVRHLGVADIVEARRVANGKFMNVTRGRSAAAGEHDSMPLTKQSRQPTSATQRTMPSEDRMQGRRGPWAKPS
jgi:hypothetical protein